MTYQEWEDQQGISPSSPEAYYAEEAWKAASVRWVKCSDRMPEMFDDVLGVDEIGNVGIGYFSDSFEKLYFLNEGPVGMPTHWMPLPTPPTKGK